MKALILRKNATATARCAQALIGKGFQVVCVDTRTVARALIQLETIDLLVMDEKVDGRLTHALALSAERRNPYVSAIIVTDRTGPETDELYDLIPCLYGLVGSESSGRLISQLALASTENFDEAQARVHRLSQFVAADDGDAALDDAALDLLLAQEDAALHGATDAPVDDAAHVLDTMSAMDVSDQAVKCDDGVEADNEKPQGPAHEIDQYEEHETPVRSLVLYPAGDVQFAALKMSHRFTVSGPALIVDEAMTCAAAAS
ncbi:imidazoleglycerol-phosphate dehydratase [Yoonia sp.]|uniref:imidazoleglycerol-phosphate dehydratase n=1 Tax=Yoonia sp. TaxID=2212373 RepID=UPI003F6BFA82